MVKTVLISTMVEKQHASVIDCVSKLLENNKKPNRFKFTAQNVKHEKKNSHDASNDCSFSDIIYSVYRDTPSDR